MFCSVSPILDSMLSASCCRDATVDLYTVMLSVAKAGTGIRPAPGKLIDKLDDKMQEMPSPTRPRRRVASGRVGAVGSDANSLCT